MWYAPCVRVFVRVCVRQDGEDTHTRTHKRIPGTHTEREREREKITNPLSDDSMYWNHLYDMAKKSRRPRPTTRTNNSEKKKIMMMDCHSSCNSSCNSSGCRKNNSNSNVNRNNTTNRDSTGSTYHNSSHFTFNPSSSSSSSFDSDSDSDSTTNNNGLDGDHDHDYDDNHSPNCNNSTVSSNATTTNVDGDSRACNANNNNNNNNSSYNITVQYISSSGLGKRKRTMVVLRHRRHDGHDHSGHNFEVVEDDHENERHVMASSGRRVRRRGGSSGGGGGHNKGTQDHSKRRKEDNRKKNRLNNNSNDEMKDCSNTLYCSKLSRCSSYDNENMFFFCCHRRHSCPLFHRRNKKSSKKNKNKTKMTTMKVVLSSYINPQIVFLILAGIGWTIVQLDLYVIPSYRNTTRNIVPSSSSSAAAAAAAAASTGGDNENGVVHHNTRYLRYYHSSATTDGSTIVTEHQNQKQQRQQQKELEEDKRHQAFLLRRQRLQNEINSTLFSVDDFVRISALLSPTSTPSRTLTDGVAVGDGDDNSTTSSTTKTSSRSKAAMEKIDPDLKPVLRILQNAGYKFLDYDTLRILPTWTDIVGLYGQEPKIYGLETCQNYRDTVPWELRSLGPAGTFNTGTNLLSTLVASNCQMDPPPGKRIARFLWQSPWGKHIPSQFVHNHTHTPKLGMKVSKYNNTLAVVTTRDPLTWIVSMCDQNYAARYVHSKELCPNLVPYESDLQQYQFKTPDHQHDPHRPVKLKYTPVAVKYSDEIIARHRSMADMWNDFYGDYVSLPIDDGIEQSNDINIDTNNINEKDTKKRPSLPGRIIVRLEDLIFHADKVVPQICECMGATYHPDGTDGNILLIPETVNQNDGVQDLDSTITGILRTIIKYGTPSKRLERFQDMQQLVAAKKLLNGTLMDLFGYPPVPDIPSLKSVVS